MNVRNVSCSMGDFYGIFVVEMPVRPEFATDTCRVVNGLHAAIEAHGASDIRLVEVYRMVLPMAAITGVVSSPNAMGCRMQVMFSYRNPTKKPFAWPKEEQ